MPDGGTFVVETANVSLGQAYCDAHLDAKPGKHVLVTVSDSGHGMDRETLERIFEPFFTTKGAGKGTGLGLAMVYGIVKGHGGHITCYSEPGIGTTFKIYLPVLEMEVENDLASSGEMPAFGTETLLLVDDEDLIRDLGKTILTHAGYTVVTASDGLEALAVYVKEKDRVSLVILDLIMPQMGGKQCLEELLKINPEARVLIASGQIFGAETVEALRGNVRGFAEKPFDPKKLLKAVRQILDEP
jgi:CheY-like chemotaxis protein